MESRYFRALSSFVKKAGNTKGFIWGKLFQTFFSEKLQPCDSISIPRCYAFSAEDLARWVELARFVHSPSNVRPIMFARGTDYRSN